MTMRPPENRMNPMGKHIVNDRGFPSKEGVEPMHVFKENRGIGWGST